MKLCIVTHQVIAGDGQGRVNYEIACEAIRQGHDVTLLASAMSCGRSPSDIAPEFAQHSQVNGIPIPVIGRGAIAYLDCYRCFHVLLFNLS